MKSGAFGSILVGVLVALVALLLVCLRSASVEAAYPVERARHEVSSSILSRIVGLFRGASAEAENVRLRSKVASLSLLGGEVERLSEENSRLRRALGYAERGAQEWVAAEVLSAGGGAAGAHETLRVGKGSLAGVAEGAVVAVPEGLVGRVKSVTPHTAEVMLVTDPAFRAACEVESGRPVRATGIVSGRNAERLILRHLKHAEDLPSRARVLTSGRGGIFPCGLEVGTLLGVNRDPGGLVRDGEVLPKVDCSTLEDVFIRRER